MNQESLRMHYFAEDARINANRVRTGRKSLDKAYTDLMKKMSKKAKTTRRRPKPTAKKH